MTTSTAAILPSARFMITVGTNNSDIVVEVQRLRTEGDAVGAGRLEGELVARMTPLVTAKARGFVSKRSSLALEDLIQVGLLAIYKASINFKAGSSRSGNPNACKLFEQWALPQIVRAMKDLQWMQSQDVHVSYDARRGDIKSKERVKALNPGMCTSKDAPLRNEEGDGCSRSLSRHLDGELAQSADTAEDILITEETLTIIRRYVNSLPPEQRELICWKHGIGRPAMSLRDVAKLRKCSRTKVEAVYKKGIATLAKSHALKGFSVSF